MKNNTKKITYKKSGVDIKKAESLISPLMSQKSPQKNKKILSKIGGFSSLYEIDIKKYRNPVIVSGTDGVGTKLRIAMKMNEHRYIGQDLLAMCVNDVITSGADPMIFLDYLATSSINIRLHRKVLLGIKKSCDAIGVSLVGGETAEMPGLYNKDDYDLAGFCVGIVNKSEIIDPSKIKSNDILIGIKSNGLHSNGYSLVNKLLDKKMLSLNKTYLGINLGKTLIKPTVIYSDIIKKIKTKIKGCAHITGGGITENLPRILPDALSARVNLKSWRKPKIFRIIQEKSKLNESEMLNTFNCGIGMIVVIDKRNKVKIINECNKLNHKAIEIGVINRNAGSKIIYE
tara:strand:+ start:421 stop:1452 length:1032 start_codon:yes stop_codon:yes gene_type:complete